MDILIWIGTALSALGLAGLVYCIVAAMGARRAGLSEDAMRERLRRLIPWNLGALLLSCLGLMVVATGLILG